MIAVIGTEVAWLIASSTAGTSESVWLISSNTECTANREVRVVECKDKYGKIVKMLITIQ